MEKPKIINNNSPLLNRNFYFTSLKEDVDFINKYGPSYTKILEEKFSDVNISKFISETLDDLIIWQLCEGRLGSQIAISGPLRYAILTGIFPHIPTKLGRRDIIVCLRDEPFTQNEFIDVPYIKLDNGMYRETIDPLPKSAKGFTIVPYLMHTDPYLPGYSGYLKK